MNQWGPPPQSASPEAPSSTWTTVKSHVSQDSPTMSRAFNRTTSETSAGAMSDSSSTEDMLVMFRRFIHHSAVSAVQVSTGLASVPVTAILAFCTRPFHRNRWLTRVPTRWCHTVFWDQVLKHGVCYIYSWHSSPLNKHHSRSDHVGCSSQSLPSRFPNQCVQISQSNYQVCRNNPFDDATQKLYEGPALSCLMHMHVQLNSASKRSLRVTISL